MSHGYRRSSGGLADDRSDAQQSFQIRGERDGTGAERSVVPLPIAIRDALAAASSQTTGLVCTVDHRVFKSRMTGFGPRRPFGLKIQPTTTSLRLYSPDDRYWPGAVLFRYPISPQAIFPHPASPTTPSLPRMSHPPRHAKPQQTHWHAAILDTHSYPNCRDKEAYPRTGR